MKFEELHDLIPYATGSKNHIVKMSPYNAITLALPGKHQHDTEPAGGDFVVMVDDNWMGWVNHQFTHDDLFADIQAKVKENEDKAKKLMAAYAKIVFGEDPNAFIGYGDAELTSLDGQTFLYAVQCLAVAEHRRYPQFEKKGGGRFLPARFSAGIVYGNWTAEDCKAVQRKGRPGVEMLEKIHGKPPSLKELAGN